MLQTTQLIGFGGGVSGGLSALTSITAAMWDGETPAKWTVSNDDAARDAGGSGFGNIRIKHATAPVLNGDFVLQWKQVGDGEASTSTSWGMYDIAEDSTWGSTAHKMNLHTMTSSYWFEMDGTGTFETRSAGTGLTSGISFSANDIFKYQRTGTSLKLFVGDVEKQEWTSVTASLRFCISGFNSNEKANIEDVQFQN